ncbi:hypothetical protein [Methylobacterium sp.]|jgi:hypothetical protein|uniref:hypothetical protein n=1 Tax=Methylobacterium sp. TaxID=409 RepID=UPI0025D2C048|nr:hypothetical protein [Methylobacterium sp.]MBY0258941.1 hypothetical protein [Methylobacterium sp.]
MTFFIGIAGPWLVVATLALLSINRDRDLAVEHAARSAAPDGASSQSVAHSAYLA